LPKAFGLYERSRVGRTARAVLSAREFGRLCHAKGVERIVRNNLGRAGHRSASTTRSSGFTAGVPTRASPPEWVAQRSTSHVGQFAEEA
jgi:hypothetical protein